MKDLLSRIAFVHKCVGCSKILQKEDFNRAFCFDCREVYLVSKMEICPECALEVKECSCMPKLLKKEGAITFRKLFFYNKHKQSQPQNRLIYYIKRNKSRRVISDIAKELEPIIKKEMGEIDFNKTANEIDCQIRAFTPWPSAYMFIGGKRVKIINAAVGGSVSEVAGTVVDTKNGLTVACGGGTSIILNELQPEGKGAMPAKAFLNGYPIEIGEKLL